MTKFPVLSRIQKPADVKGLSPTEKLALCAEIRSKILETVSENGGHLSANLGTVELTVALESVFFEQDDRIIWDVGHQCYAHKLLTGRYQGFSTLRKAGGISGFQSPAESVYDPFYTGHAGVAISTALGMSAAYAQAGKERAMVIAVVGDGSLGAGPSLEALNSIRSCRKSGFLLIINDNRMAISRSVGALSNHLNKIITGRIYNRFKIAVKYTLKRLPFGSRMIGMIRKIESAAKGILVPGAFFEELGFKYVGPINGHDVTELTEKLQMIRENCNIPVCLHVVTEKGRGYAFSEKEPDRYHGVGPFDLQTGVFPHSNSDKLTFSQALGESLIELGTAHPDVVALTAAMSSGTGLSGFEKKFPKRFYDVGIAEEHAAAFAAGLAKGGLRPVVALYATFLQRSLDQIFHDIALQNLPVIFCIDRSGAVEDGPTHHGIYDLGFLRALPNLSILLPSSEAILYSMLNAAYDHKKPVMLRYPKGKAPSGTEEPPLVWGRSAVLKEGKDGMIWAAGAECRTAQTVSDLLRAKGKDFGIRDVRFLKPFDTEALAADLKAGKRILSIEDAILGTGLSAEIDSAAVANGLPVSHIQHFGWPNDRFVPHGNVEELRQKFGLSPEAIAQAVID